jgi:hypothetical protein
MEVEHVLPPYTSLYEQKVGKGLILYGNLPMLKRATRLQALPVGSCGRIWQAWKPARYSAQWLDAEVSNKRAIRL